MFDDLEDWHFTVFGGGSLPTGSANHRLADGSIDPGKSLGFGKPSYSLGLTATKVLGRNLTFNLETSLIRFQETTYGDGNRVKFGAAEDRINGSLAYRLLTNADQRVRLDGVIEALMSGAQPGRRERRRRRSHRRQGALPLECRACGSTRTT